MEYCLQYQREYLSYKNFLIEIHYLQPIIVGPFLFEWNLNFLKKTFSGPIHEFPLADVAGPLFQLDGCLIHNARTVRAWK